jgi:N-acetylglucosaminyldiphosphoundecaprenol N-acetyl-beta-D-mannosaminyltransferase
VDLRDEVSAGRVTICGVEVDAVTQAEALDRVEAMIETRRPHLMAVVNASKLTLANDDQELRRVLARADLVTADGMSVVWGVRALGARLPGRVTGIDTLEALVARAAERGWGVYFLGATERAIEDAVANLRRANPSLKVAGYHHGYFRGREAEVVEAVRAARPDLLFVGMGSPAQEMFLAEHLEQLGVPFSLGVGGSFDHLAGHVRRAPLWMQRAGLEWLDRLAREPRRLWRRYVFGNARFGMLLVRERLRRRPVVGSR